MFQCSSWVHRFLFYAAELVHGKRDFLPLLVKVLSLGLAALGRVLAYAPVPVLELRCSCGFVGAGVLCSGILTLRPFRRGVFDYIFLYIFAAFYSYSRLFYSRGILFMYVNHHPGLDVFQFFFIYALMCDDEAALT